jgi:hypothetical protein
VNGDKLRAVFVQPLVQYSGYIIPNLCSIEGSKMADLCRSIELHRKVVPKVVDCQYRHFPVKGYLFFDQTKFEPLLKKLGVSSTHSEGE